MARGGDWDFSLPVSAPESAPEIANKLDSFRPVPTTGIGEAMVFCIGCGDPMTLDAALTHMCELPPPGWL